MGYSPWGCKESDTTERLQLVISSNYVYNILKGKIYIEPLTFNLLQPLCIITLFDIPLVSVLSFPCGSDCKESACDVGDLGFNPWVGKIPWRRKWQRTPVFLPRKFHGWRSLVGYSPRGHKESDTTERLHFHFHFLLELRDTHRNEFM